MSFRSKTFNFAAALLLSTTFVSGAAMAADPAITTTSAPKASVAAVTSIDQMDPNTVVATVNGEKITLGKILQVRKTLPPQLSQQLPPDTLNSMILEQLIEQTAVQQTIDKDKTKLEELPEVKEQLKNAHDTVLQRAFIKQQIEPKINDAAVKKVYDETVANKPAVKEAHIRHILVKTKEEAEKIIKELKAGKKFSDLANKYSVDKAKGGDLGWMKADELVPDFSKAAFAMKANTTSITPVKSPFGWHVIQVLAYRDSTPPTLEQATPTIRQKLAQQAIQDTVQNIVKQSTITRDDKIIKPAPDMTAPQVAPASNAAPAPSKK